MGTGSKESQETTEPQSLLRICAVCTTFTSHIFDVNQKTDSPICGKNKSTNSKKNIDNSSLKSISWLILTSSSDKTLVLFHPHQETEQLYDRSANFPSIPIPQSPVKPTPHLTPRLKTSSLLFLPTNSSYPCLILYNCTYLE